MGDRIQLHVIHFIIIEDILKDTDRFTSLCIPNFDSALACNVDFKIFVTELGAANGSIIGYFRNERSLVLEDFDFT